MKRLTYLLLLFAASLAFGQGPSLTTGQITAQATNCTTSSQSPACVIIQLSNAVNTVAITVPSTTTFSATLQFEASPDGQTTWVALSATPSGGGSTVTSTTASGVWTASVAGYTHIRVRGSAYTSGVATVSLNPSQAAVASSGSGSGTITGVTAGTGLSGGGASGSVTLNMALGYQAATYSSGTQTASISQSTLCTAVACPAGTYLVSVVLNETGTGCTAAGVGAVKPEINATNNQGTAISPFGLVITNSGQLVTPAYVMNLTTTGAGAASGTGIINTNGSAPIQIQATLTACTTPGPWTGYQLYAYVTRIN